MSPVTPPPNQLAEKTPVTVLTAEELARWMAPSSESRLIEFFASWCIYHMLSKRKLAQLQTALDGQTRTGSIDAVGNEDILHSFGINHIPTIGYFSGPIRLFWTGDTDVELMVEDIERAHLLKEQT